MATLTQCKGDGSNHGGFCTARCAAAFGHFLAASQRDYCPEHNRWLDSENEDIGHAGHKHLRPSYNGTLVEIEMPPDEDSYNDDEDSYSDEEGG